MRLKQRCGLSPSNSYCQQGAEGVGVMAKGRANMGDGRARCIFIHFVKKAVVLPSRNVSKLTNR